MSARLILGPMLRYAGEREATVWVETDGPCEVEVLGHSTRTFHVEGHHYAIVCIEGLEPGSTTEYEVLLDGERHWPQPESGFPPSCIPTIRRGGPLRVSFGSCRVSAPHAGRFLASHRGPGSPGRGVDALRALAMRIRDDGSEPPPHLLLMLGDQVYADDVSPATRDFIRSRRDTSQPPGEEVADFEEYVRLYMESWGEPAFRWLASTVPTAMIFDDHDVVDDWNTSRTWVDTMRSKPWWHDRIVAAFMSYWLYQHLGNLSPRELADDALLAEIKAAEDGGPALRRFSERADRHPESTRWSFHRDLGDARLVIVDSRAGRVLEEGNRSMLDDAEWAWLEGELRGDVDHVLLGSSLPIFLPEGTHWGEAFSERLAGGALGRRAARLGEGIRQAIDLEHWPAFNTSLRRLVEMIRSAGAGERGRAPASITALSGDVHFSYLAELSFPENDVTSSVHQAVCSPFRNPLGPPERALMKTAGARPTQRVAKALAKRVGVPDPGVGWRIVEGQRFDNQVATLDMDGREAILRLERTEPGAPGLITSFERRLA